MPAEPEALSYRAAGVDIDADQVVERIKPLVKRTFRPEVMAGLGGFGALFELGARYREPVLVSGTHGVGTDEAGPDPRPPRHDGIDLVAMCVNDVFVQAESLFFLDVSRLGSSMSTTVAVVAGIAKAASSPGVP